MRYVKFIILVLFVFILSSLITYATTCCQIAKNNQVCSSSISEADCKEGMFFKGDCSELEECRTKVCCDMGNKCLVGSNELSCSIVGGVSYPESPECELSQCNKNVCCEFFGNFYVVDKSKCSKIISDIKDPVACFELGSKSILGCCVNTKSSSCEFTTKENCYQTDDVNNLMFFDNEKCSKVGKCECQEKARIGSDVNDKNSLYYYDSCGNIENKYKDCNEGEIATKNMDNENYSCKNLNCDETWDNPYTDEDFDGKTVGDKVKRLNGEEWCEYQQVQVGFGRDLPGTHHYVHSCVSGFEAVRSVDPDSSKRTNYCIEFRNKGKSSIEVKQIYTDCQDYNNDIEECEKDNRCKYIPVKGLLGWKVIFARESGSPDKLGKMFNKTSKYNLYDSNGKNIIILVWENIFHRTDNDSAYYDYSFDYFESYSGGMRETYNVDSYVFVNSSLLEPNKNYFTKEVLLGGEGEAVDFDTFAPDGTNGSCIPIVAYESSDVDDRNECSGIDVFNTNNIKKWAGWGLDLPIDLNYYFKNINEFAKLNDSKYQREFLLEMANRKANLYNSRCGANYNYIGGFTNSLEWNVPALNMKSANVQHILDVFVNRIDSNLFKIVKYGYLKEDNLFIGGSKRPGGTIYVQ